IGTARDWMCQLNQPGSRFGKLAGVAAMTDVTGFGLLGHLVEMCEGSGVSARIQHALVPSLPGVPYYLAEGCVPGGT
ncbi:AIR synthase-related protein, partial [Acinetobacter baumannii]